MNKFFIGLLINLLESAGKIAVVKLLDDFQKKDPDGHATTIIYVYRGGMVHGKKWVDDDSNDWKDTLQEELMEVFEEQFEKYDVGVPDVVIRNPPKLPTPIPNP